MAKPKIASVWLEACAGCHMSFLDIDERIVGLLDKVELTATPITDIKEFPEVEVGVIEGALGNEEELHLAKELRERCKILIAWGDCAVFGGINCMRNFMPAEKVLEEGYVNTASTVNPGRVIPRRDLPPLLPQAIPVDRAVKVDVYVPGCELIMYVLGLLEVSAQDNALRLTEDREMENKKHTVVVIHHPDRGTARSPWISRGRTVTAPASTSPSTAGSGLLGGGIFADAGNPATNIRHLPSQPPRRGQGLRRSARRRHTRHGREAARGHAHGAVHPVARPLFFHLSSPDLLFGFDADPAVRNVAGLAAEHPDLAVASIGMKVQPGDNQDARRQKVHRGTASPAGQRSWSGRRTRCLRSSRRTREPQEGLILVKDYLAERRARRSSHLGPPTWVSSTTEYSAVRQAVPEVGPG